MAAYDTHEEVRLLRQEPGHQRVGRADDRQDDQELTGLRLGNFVQVRDVIEEELEAALAGKKTRRRRVDTAATRGNEIIEQFAKAQKKG